MFRPRRWTVEGPSPSWSGVNGNRGSDAPPESEPWFTLAVCSASHLVSASSPLPLQSLCVRTDLNKGCDHATPLLKNFQGPPVVSKDLLLSLANKFIYNLTPSTFSVSVP